MWTWANPPISFQRRLCFPFLTWHFSKLFQGTITSPPPSPDPSMATSCLATLCGWLMGELSSAAPELISASGAQVPAQIPLVRIRDQSRLQLQMPWADRSDPSSWPQRSCLWLGLMPAVLGGLDGNVSNTHVCPIYSLCLGSGSASCVIPALSLRWHACACPLILFSTFMYVLCMYIDVPKTCQASWLS